MSEKIDIFLFENFDFNLDKLKSLINKINSMQNNFYFYLNEAIKLPLQDNDIQKWDYLIKTLTTLSSDFKYKIALTSSPIEHNWFSFTNHSEFVSIITTSDWEYLSDLPVYSYLLYEIIENYQELRIGFMNAHDETIGCINDMCSYKLDINFKLKTGWICHDCFNIWQDYFNETEIESMIKIIDFIRLVALNRENIWKLSYDYPYPIAVRFKLMSSEINSYIKFQKLIDLYDSIIRYIAFVLIACIKEDNISNKIKNLIKKINDNNPTLGTWENLIVKSLNLPSSCYNLLSDSDLNMLQEITNLIKESDLRTDRNDYRGHNYTGQDLEEYLNLYLKKIPMIQKLLFYLERSIFNYKLAKIKRYNPRQGIRYATIECLISDSNVFNTEDIILENEPYDINHIILYNQTDRIHVSMFPYIVSEICNECGHERILFLDGKYENNQKRFIDTLIGHRTTVRDF